MDIILSVNAVTVSEGDSSLDISYDFRKKCSTCIGDAEGETIYARSDDSRSIDDMETVVIAACRILSALDRHGNSVYNLEYLQDMFPEAMVQ